MSKNPNQSAADSTMALLGQAMDRNTRLAKAPVVVTVTPRVIPAEEVSPSSNSDSLTTSVPSASRRSHRQQGRTTGLRLTPEDHARINRILKQALSMGERIPMSDAVRLALMAYNPASLNLSDLQGLNALDGRTRDGKERE